MKDGQTPMDAISFTKCIGQNDQVAGLVANSVDRGGRAQLSSNKGFLEGFHSTWARWQIL